MPPTTFTFVEYETANATVTAGESSILSGATFTGFDPNNVFLEYIEGSTGTQIPTSDGIQQADGKWRLPWTAPASSSYTPFFEYRDCSAEPNDAYINLTDQ